MGPETATLPEDWLPRVIRVHGAATGSAVGLCLEVHDLAISKYVAGRAKDLGFNAELARRGMTDRSRLLERLTGTPLVPELRALVLQRIRSDHPP